MNGHFGGVSGHSYIQSIPFTKKPANKSQALFSRLFYFISSDSYITYAEKYGFSIQFMEAFIWSFGDTNNILLLSLLAYVIFSDMPMINAYTPYMSIMAED